MIRIATDAGGTFTDLVAFSEDTGTVFVGKALTTPRDPSLGVLDTIRQAAGTGLDPRDVSFFVHGGTTVINAITERKGVKTALVTTRGFRDVLAIGRGNRPDLYNLHSLPSEPFVPRYLRLEVTERIDARGRVRTPLVMDDVEAAAETLAESGVAAVAVVFLHAYANPVHEAAVAARLRARLPGVAVTASHEVSRNWREYERSNTAVLSAYVQPIMASYLGNLDRALTTEGMPGQRYCMQSNGGLAKFAAAEAGPLALVESGPAGGVAGAVRIGQALGESDILYLDVGGTTAKCSLIRDGQPVLKSEYKLEWTRLLPGYPVQVPVVDIVEIGAGGGSIAHIGPAGELRVGPESAGADPGPACYGRGGEKPTVTDAKLLTGAIDPDRFAGGRMRLDRALAAKAFAPLAEHLGMSVIGAAEAAIRLAEANMINALKLVTIQRGHDPRDLTMVVSGGGGPMHAATLGRELGVRRTVIPRHVGLFSAWGMLTARPRVDLRQTSFSTLADATPGAARALFHRLEEEAAAYFDAGPDTPLVFERQIEMRYVGQEHTVATPFDPGAGADALREAFHARHEQTYTFRLPDTEIELVTYHLGAELDTPRVDLPEIAANGAVEAALIGDLEVWFGENGGAERAQVYDRERLPPGAVLDGPVLIEEPTATTMVLPGQRATIDRFGLVAIEEVR
jgi:N-methylhydantoinase A